jgi:hypothetical protein
MTTCAVGCWVDLRRFVVTSLVDLPVAPRIWARRAAPDLQAA